MDLHSYISSSEVLRFLIKFILFLLVFWLISYLLFIPINKIYFNTCTTIYSVLHSKGDIYIFGSSRASHHYNSNILSKNLGLSCYNAGSDGKNATYQLGLLKMLLKNHKPKVIIYEVGDFTHSFDNNSIIYLYPYYFRDPEIKYMIKEDDKFASLKFMFPLYAYNGQLLSILKKRYLSPFNAINGFQPLSGTIHPYLIEKLKHTNLENNVEQIDELAYNNFCEFVRLCKKYDIKIIFCYSPTFVPSVPEEFDLISKLAKDENIQFLIYSNNPIFNWNTKYFRDNGHLNSEGADKYSEIVSSDLSHYLKDY